MKRIGTGLRRPHRGRERPLGDAGRCCLEGRRARRAAARYHSRSSREARNRPDHSRIIDATPVSTTPAGATAGTDARDRAIAAVLQSSPGSTRSATSVSATVWASRCTRSVWHSSTSTLASPSGTNAPALRASLRAISYAAARGSCKTTQGKKVLFFCPCRVRQIIYLCALRGAAYTKPCPDAPFPACPAQNRVFCRAPGSFPRNIFGPETTPRR